MLRVRETFKPSLSERVYANNFTTSRRRCVKSREHPWVVGSRVLTPNKDELCALKIIEGDGPLSCPNRFTETSAARLMTEVRAVWEMIRPKAPSEELIEKSSLITCPPRGIENRSVWITARAELSSKEREGLVPRDRRVMLCLRGAIERRGEATLLFKPSIALGEECLERPRLKKIILKAALRSLRPHTFITDEVTARSLVPSAEPASRE